MVHNEQLLSYLRFEENTSIIVTPGFGLRSVKQSLCWRQQRPEPLSLCLQWLPPCWQLWHYLLISLWECSTLCHCLLVLHFSLLKLGSVFGIEKFRDLFQRYLPRLNSLLILLALASWRRESWPTSGNQTQVIPKITDVMQIKTR